MIKYAKIIDNDLGLCEVGLGTNIDFYKSIGMTRLDVQQSDIDNAWYLTDKCPMKTDEQKEQEEKKRIAMLYLTAADVERGIYKARGMDFEDIINFILTYPQDGLDLKALRIELKANHFYRGNVYVNVIGNILGFTEEQLNKFFEDGNYEHLLVKTDEEIPAEEIVLPNELTEGVE